MQWAQFDHLQFGSAAISHQTPLIQCQYSSLLLNTVLLTSTRVLRTLSQRSLTSNFAMTLGSRTSHESTFCEVLLFGANMGMQHSGTHARLCVIMTAAARQTASKLSMLPTKFLPATLEIQANNGLRFHLLF